MGWKLSSFFFLWNIWFGKSDWKVRMIHFFGGSWRKKTPGQQIAWFFFSMNFAGFFAPSLSVIWKKGESGWDAFVGTPTLLAWFHFFLYFIKHFSNMQQNPNDFRENKGKQENGKQTPKKTGKTSPKRFAPPQKKHLNCMKWWKFLCGCFRHLRCWNSQGIQVVSPDDEVFFAGDQVHPRIFYSYP